MELRQSHSLLPGVRGFTLIEMIVAIGIFMFVMVIAIGSLVSIVGADRKAQSIEAVVDNLRFAIDDVSREVRTGSHYYCDSGIDWQADEPNGANDADCQTGGTQIILTDQDNDRVGYRIADAATCGTAYESAGSGCIMRCTVLVGQDADCTNFVPITSSEINIDPSSTKFYLLGSGLPKAAQAKVVVLLSASITQGVSTPTNLHLQTTITER